MDEARPHFLSLAPADYLRLLVEGGEPRYRGDQIVDWIFKRGATSPEAMTNISKTLRASLVERFDWTLPRIAEQLDSDDGATKLLLVNSRNQYMEAVILRYEGRTSLCVSSQVGCKLACSFCQTGKLGFFAHLGTHEILAQYVVASQIARAEGRRISHVVFMGMGEPLDNYDQSVKAANILIDAAAFGLSQRHVTLSTSGIAPKVVQLAQDTTAALAVSLHAADDDLRSELMPINRKYPLAELKAAIVAWQQATGKKVTIEYILIAGKNCGADHATDLVRFLQGLKAKVNLIPFNAHPGLPYERPSAEEIRAFQKHLADRSIPAPVRYSLGLEVSAACGQLAAKQVAELMNAPRRHAVVAESATTETVTVNSFGH